MKTSPNCLLFHVSIESFETERGGGGRKTAYVPRRVADATVIREKQKNGRTAYRTIFMEQQILEDHLRKEVTIEPPEGAGVWALLARLLIASGHLTLRDVMEALPVKDDAVSGRLRDSNGQGSA